MMIERKLIAGFIEFSSTDIVTSGIFLKDDWILLLVTRAICVFIRKSQFYR